MVRTGLIILGFLSIVALAACSSPPPAAPAPTASTAAAALATEPPAGTPTPARTATPTPTATATATVTPTSTPMHPLSIEAMRRRAYPGSDLIVEETLSPGSNYSRYLVSYRSEGLKIYALLTVPAGERPETGWPVVVFNHGYIPPAQYRTTERYVAYVDAFARSGYIVLRPDYRGHGNSEGQATGAYATPDYTVDVLNAVASIKRHPDADPERIGMWGHSMGGGITVRAMVVTRDVKAGVIWAGTASSYTGLMEWWSRMQTSGAGTPAAGRGWAGTMIVEFGSPEENPQFWRSISPNAYLADLSGPLQLHHGTADESVPVETSEVLYREVQQAGGEVEYHVYSGDDHNLSKNLAVALQRSVEFFDRYLK